MIYKVPLYSPFLGQEEKDLVNEALDTTWISSKGKFIQQFEKEFAAFVGRKHAISVCNGTVALHLALEALHLEKNTGVLCPSLTYVSSANAIRYAGLIPIFVDCNEYGLSDLENFIDGINAAKDCGIKVSAALPVHLYGNVLDANRLHSTLSKLGIKIVEDCAEAFGSKLIDSSNIVSNCGESKSELACYSFFGNKTITTGEGGMVVCDDDELYDECVTIRGVGQKINLPQRYMHTKLGYNYRMTNICAAIGVAQLRKAELIVNKKILVAEYYRKFLQSELFLKVPDNCISSNWMVTLIMNSASERDGLILYLESQGIETRPAFMPMHAMIHLGEFVRTKSMLNTEKLSSCGINVPSSPNLSKQDIEYVAIHINNFLNKFR